jgi:crotonobetainyl-CoA:carnitine CoA-transferase CaiB-like acyl-CoA transferase
VINTYPTADGDWVTVTSGTPKSVQHVLTMLGLRHDEYLGPHARPDARQAIDDHLRAWISERGTEETLRQMRSLEVVAEKVFDMEDIANSAIFKEREAIIRVQDPDLGEVRMSGVIPKFRLNPGAVRRTGPRQGHDNDEVYAEILSFDSARIEELRSRGII